MLPNNWIVFKLVASKCSLFSAVEDKFRKGILLLGITVRVDRSYKTGLTVQPLTPRISLYMELDITEGLIVVEVEQRSTADRSGIVNGDIITRVNGVNVKTTSQFRSIIEESDLRQGDRINIKLYRNGRYINKKLILGRGER